MEMLGILGVLPDILKHSAAIPPMRSYKLPGGTEPAHTWELMAPLTASPSCPFTRPIEIAQEISERILRSHLDKYGCSVELGTELVDLTQDSDCVTVRLAKRESLGQAIVEESATFKYVVGADGARGVVRKSVGLSFVGETCYSDQFIVGDVEVENLDTDFWHFWGNPASDCKTTISLRPSGPGRKLFAIFMVGQGLSGHNLTQPDNFREFFRTFTGRADIEFHDFPWLSSFRPNMRMADKFNEGRVFIVGDAGHVHSPTGGQGMNSGVQDSLNLAWKLALVVNGHSPESLLLSYTDERLPVIAEMLRQTSKIHTKTFEGGELRGGEDRGWSRGKALYMLDINYRWSSIVLEERFPHTETLNRLRSRSYGADGKNLCAGDRAPEAPGLLSCKDAGETSLFKILDPMRHTVFIFTAGDHSRTKAVLETTALWPRQLIQTVAISKQTLGNDPSADLNLIDGKGHAHDAYMVDDQEFAVVVVRPDGVVGGIVREVRGVSRYFERLFGLP